MLEIWQNKFPATFQQYPNLFTDLNAKEQDDLARLLNLIEKANLLNDYSLDKILNNPNQTELIFLITKLSELICLDKSTFYSLLENPNLLELQESIDLFLEHFPLTQYSFKFLFTSSNPLGCAEFMIRTCKEGIDLREIIQFLSHDIVASGIEPSLALFDLSHHFTYTRQHFPVFSSLTKILANPLCQTIFNARLRNFSAYDPSTEPLTAIDADKIIKDLAENIAEEDKIQRFFNYLSKFRPYPYSQNYFCPVDVKEKVIQALQTLSSNTLTKVENEEDYLHTKTMLTTLRNNEALFAKIKYEVASAIESQDVYSTFNYDDLMGAIKAAIDETQLETQRILESLTTELTNTKGYHAYIANSLNHQSFLANSKPSLLVNMQDATDNLTMQRK